MSASQIQEQPGREVPPSTPEARGRGERPRVLLVDDDADLLAVLSRALWALGFEAACATSAEEGLRAFQDDAPDAAIVDVNLPSLDGFAFLERAQRVAPSVPILMLSAYGGLDDAVRAVSAGAAHYLVKPIEADALDHALRRALEDARIKADLVPLRRDEVAGSRSARLLGQSAGIRRIRGLIDELGAARCNVLIQGETGTGKELVARALHEKSGRRGEFVAINCAALPEGLIESTLFGHERGAFTGALRREIGAFERASGGTLLLDEITEMRPDLQAKLLRVLQEMEVERVGGRDAIPLDLRVIATTNRDPEEAVRLGQLREDLLYRLDVVRFRIPPLRDRVEDIPVLATALLARAAEEFGREMPQMSTVALKVLQEYPWPGNVRQLQHVMQRAVLTARGGVVEASDLAVSAVDARPRTATPTAVVPPPQVPPQPEIPYFPSTPSPIDPMTSIPFATQSTTPSVIPTLNLADLEKLAITKALAETGGNRVRAARLLGIHVRTLHRKLREEAVAAAQPMQGMGNA